MEYSTIKDLIDLAFDLDTTISEVVIRTEMEDSERSKISIEKQMMHNLEVMKNSINEGRKGIIRSTSGVIGGESHRLVGYSGPLSGGVIS